MKPILDFAIVIATVRPRSVTAPTFEHLFARLTLPTDVFILDGSKGKVFTQNWALLKLADAGAYRFWAALDDDVILPQEWQDEIAKAFTDIPSLGEVGIDAGDSEGESIRRIENQPIEQIGRVRYRPMEQANIIGTATVMPTQVAINVGPYPHDGESHYEWDEDWWRCQRVRQMGYKTGYVVCPGGPAQILDYPDDENYVAMKKADTERLRPRTEQWRQRRRHGYSL